MLRFTRVLLGSNVNADAEGNDGTGKHGYIYPYVSRHVDANSRIITKSQTQVASREFVPLITSRFKSVRRLARGYPEHIPKEQTLIFGAFAN